MSVVDTRARPTDADIRAVEKRLITNGRTLDLTGVKQPHRAARLLWAYLHHKHEARSCFLACPEETKRLGYGDTWFVCWEGGPYDWAVYLSGHGDIFGAAYHWENADMPEPYGPGREHVRHLDNVGRWYIEPYHRFSLNFIPN